MYIASSWSSSGKWPQGALCTVRAGEFPGLGLPRPAPPETPESCSAGSALCGDVIVPFCGS